MGARPEQAQAAEQAFERPRVIEIADDRQQNASIANADPPILVQIVHATVAIRVDLDVGGTAPDMA